MPHTLVELQPLLPINSNLQINTFVILNGVGYLNKRDQDKKGGSQLGIMLTSMVQRENASVLWAEKHCANIILSQLMPVDINS